MRVHQICARLQFGDAVTGQVLRIHETVSSWGWESFIYATAHDARMAPTDEGLEAYRKGPMRSREDILVYHLSVYDENHRLYLDSRNRKVLIYHNITPPEFLAPYDPHLAEVCRRGRELMPRLRDCDLALGDSEYNRLELVEAGFAAEKTGVLPIFVDTGALGGEYSRPLYRELSDGRVNLLFVGRMVPNKRVEDLIDLFAVYNGRVNAYSRLLLVGTTWSVAYNAELARRIRKYGLQGAVSIPGWSWGVSDEDLRAFYRAASVFITCSRHEGFCVPLLEAMYFKVPVLARADAAVPFTLGGAGMTFREIDLPLLAEAVHELANDAELRAALTEEGTRRLADFDPARTAETLRSYLEGLV
ncbi:MAG: glycosyltransferase [Actinobacteria bacterium]|jgi:glycosyltransferase involved in cell wall biosynthesis|nr:MAG: glycosyltransferase [Actinomycetota bacterium]